MTIYKLEPLMIQLNAPSGVYEVTLSIKSESDTEFTVSEKSAGTVVKNQCIGNGCNTDVKFEVKSDGDIKILIYCDGNITATAMADYIK